MEHLKIVENFAINDVIKKITKLEAGHINSTYMLEGEKFYILQKINKNVFNSPEKVMDNLEMISSHVSGKLKDLHDSERRFIKNYKAIDGKHHFVDVGGDYWRLLNFQENTKSMIHVSTKEVSYQAAKAFGHFQKVLLDLNPDGLHITIPDFHNPAKRLLDFEKAWKGDLLGRKDNALAEREFIFKNGSIVDTYLKLADIPVRVIHGDAKLSNVLFDTVSGEGLCVIDLDTVMPGATLFDFGDLVRSLAGSLEDERDLEKININLEYFEAVARGYLSEAGGFLTKGERENLIFGPKIVIYLLGIRFLTDYLNGDNYFKIDYPGHNLVRAQNQFKLLKSLLSQENELNSILEAI